MKLILKNALKLMPVLSVLLINASCSNSMNIDGRPCPSDSDVLKNNNFKISALPPCYAELGAREPSSAVDINGNILLTWSEIGDESKNIAASYDGTYHGKIYFQKFSADSKQVGEKIKISDNGYNPSIISDSKNNVLISWLEVNEKNLYESKLIVQSIDNKNVLKSRKEIYSAISSYDNYTIAFNHNDELLVVTNKDNKALANIYDNSFNLKKSFNPDIKNSDLEFKIRTDEQNNYIFYGSKLNIEYIPSQKPDTKLIEIKKYNENGEQIDLNLSKKIKFSSVNESQSYMSINKNDEILISTTTYNEKQKTEIYGMVLNSDGSIKIPYFKIADETQGESNYTTKITPLFNGDKMTFIWSTSFDSKTVDINPKYRSSYIKKDIIRIKTFDLKGKEISYSSIK